MRSFGALRADYKIQNEKFRGKAVCKLLRVELPDAVGAVACPTRRIFINQTLTN